MTGAGVAAVTICIVSTATAGQLRAPGGRIPPPSSDTFGTPNTPTPGSAYGPLPALRTPDTNTTLYVTGRVLLDSGGPPPESVAIERICTGSREVKGYTDSKGRFSVDLRRSNRLVFDAGATDERQPNSGIRPGGLDSCDIRAYLQGFRSDVIPLAGRRAMDHPDVGVIVLHRIAHIEGTTISATSALAPDPAKKAYAKAQRAMKKGKTHDAIAALEKAVDLYPKYAAAWYDLGLLRQMDGRDEGAEDAFQHSVEADPKYVRPYVALARRAVSKQQWADAVRWSDHALRLDPDTLPDAWLLNATGHLFTGNLDAAEKSVSELLKLDGAATTPEAEQIASYVYTRRRNWPEAAVHLRRFIALSRPGADQDYARKLLDQVQRNGALAGSIAH